MSNFGYVFLDVIVVLIALIVLLMVLGGIVYFVLRQLDKHLDGY